MVRYLSLELPEELLPSPDRAMLRGRAGMCLARHGPKGFQVPRAESDDMALRSANKLEFWDMETGSTRKQALVGKVE